eukprot:scaffold210478_cov17-Tisochrysis_lutea.AAC.1
MAGLCMLGRRRLLEFQLELVDAEVPQKVARSKRERRTGEHAFTHRIVECSSDWGCVKRRGGAGEGFLAWLQGR